MRPEGTAGITRALISQKQYTELPQKYYYHGPMFRHERPQKGRLRQVRTLFGTRCLCYWDPFIG